MDSANRLRHPTWVTAKRPRKRRRQGYQTLRDYASVASRFTLSRRRDALSFGHRAGTPRSLAPPAVLVLDEAANGLNPQCIIMPYVDHLVIALLNHHWHTSGGRPVSTRDFHVVTTELDKLYEPPPRTASAGILVIGY